MEKAPVGGIVKHFGKLTDPRDENLIDHKLVDIVVIALCAVICGADSWVAVVTYGKAKQGWFETFLELPNGIPSHDTFGRVFGALDPDEFGRCFLGWVQEIAEVTEGDVLAPHNVAKNALEFSTSIPRERLRPGYGEGFQGAPLRISPNRQGVAKRNQGGQDESRTGEKTGVEGEKDV